MSEPNQFLQLDRLRQRNEELAKQLAEAQTKLAARQEYQREYSRQYYQTKTKQDVMRCEPCAREMKRASYAAHVRTAGHIARTGGV